jgi:glycosyltransferase involved in cell wall biosynthesis
MKVDIVHYWLVGIRRGEKVLDALCEHYRQADIFTHVVDPNAISTRISCHKIRTPFIGLPRAGQLYKHYLPNVSCSSRNRSRSCAIITRAAMFNFSGEEEFGIVPVEAMASGCPVVVYGRGVLSKQ